MYRRKKERRNIKSYKEKKDQMTYKDRLTRVTLGFLLETQKARRAWTDVLQI